MTIRVMTLDDLRMVLGWAANEGWNPGLDDAEAFHAADPQGFLIKVVDGAPVAAISVVNHDPGFAFLGLYICRPQFRGRGYGMEVWRAGIAHAGARSIGLDGVPEQQENYARSGFEMHSSTVRFEGQITAQADPRVRPALPADMPTLIARDARACGIDRTGFAATWFAGSAYRQSMVLMDGDDIAGFATFRRCGQGTKVGPLQAMSGADVEVLLASNPFGASAQPVIVDVQEHTSPLASLLRTRGFEPAFETARMFRGRPPAVAPAPFHAIATMELG